MDVKLIMLTICFVMAFSGGQDCKVGGKQCADHEQCCGGCCFNGECIDTYRSCLTSLNVCKDHVCIGVESCIVYTPPQCVGCEPIPLCRDLTDTQYSVDVGL